MTNESLDAARAEAFANEMSALLNHAALSLMMSLGHRTGLFDQLATLGPSTSVQVASASGLDERYVREWLAAMVCGRIVEHDAREATYRLPAEHAACLTRAAGPNNMAMLTQMIGLAASIEDRVERCFREGGGVSYAEQTKFSALQAELSGMFCDAALVDRVLPLADGVVEMLHRGARVLDAGCGRGHAACLMARAFPQSRFEGVEMREEDLVEARREARALALGNVTFRAADVHALAATEEYDLVTALEVVHDLRDPHRALRSLHAALRPGGVLLMLEPAASSDLADNVAHPFGPLLYMASTFHCMTVSLAQGGAGCGTAWGEQNARRALAEAGFDPIETKRLEDDPMSLFYVARKAS